DALPPQGRAPEESHGAGTRMGSPSSPGAESRLGTGSWRNAIRIHRPTRLRRRHEIGSHPGSEAAGQLPRTTDIDRRPRSRERSRANVGRSGFCRDPERRGTIQGDVCGRRHSGLAYRRRLVPRCSDLGWLAAGRCGFGRSVRGGRRKICETRWPYAITPVIRRSRNRPRVVVTVHRPRGERPAAIIVGRMLARAVLAALLLAAAALADPSPLVPGDPLDCFNRFEGGVTVSTVPVSGMPFARALHVKTGAVAATANAWDIRPRCFSTLAARQNDVVAVTFWMRATAAPDGRGFTSFVLERNDSPYTKSVTYTAAASADWKLVEVPFTMAETYAANAYNFSFWVTYANQEIEIGGIAIQDYGPGIPFSQLGLSTWPYAERAADAPWRATAAARIERYRKGDLAVIARDDSGQPIPGAAVHAKLKSPAFGFRT